MSDHLKQQGIQKSFVSAIIGHKDTSMTFGQYAEKYGAKILQPQIEKADFDLKHDKFYLTDKLEEVIVNSWNN